jgi:phage-related protein
VAEAIVLRPLGWVGSSRDDFAALPREVQRAFGYALYVAQRGGKHDKAKPLKGFGGAGVVEVISVWRGDTFRCVYTVRIAAAVYVLHAFKKKSKRGIATAHNDIEIIKQRLRTAEEYARAT